MLAAGLLQLVAGVLRLGQWFRAVSPAVIQGMLAGIGVIIFSSQIHVMVHDEPKKGTLENILSIPEAFQKGIFPIEWSLHHQAAYLGLITILIIILWQKRKILKIKKKQSNVIKKFSHAFTDFKKIEF